MKSHSSYTTVKHPDSIDVATLKKNPKVDTQLLSDFYRLVDASQGIIRSARGANYGLSHPLDSKVVPTDLDRDSSQIENSPSKVKET